MSRRFEDFPVRGYVLDVGPRFFLLAVVTDRLWFDGFQCLRVADVKGVGRDPYADFSEAALKKRSERKPTKPRISVDGIEELLRSAGRAFPLVAIHREKVDPDVCQIGRVIGVEAEHVGLLEIAPDATWDKSPTEYRLREITRVDFGGDYEDALYIVGSDAAG
jgi:hypothetical protein